MFGAWIGVCLAAWNVAADGEVPRVTDERLKLQLVAEAPDIVTPVGIAIDARGRLFVVESHTHFPPPNYAGPKVDRIRLLEDRDGDGRAEKVSTYFEGGVATMNVAFHPDGTLLVATRNDVSRLIDRDDDGKADERQVLVRLDTPGNYPHNGLSGFACDLAGNIWFGMGENLGADYKLIGADGRTLTGGGEGGNIYRCNRDGKELQRVATGFWNPFHVAFDAFGRLFTVDNDPDSRPPCRFIHVVADGDYGYRFRNGRRGTHPFTAWNGELPGTLPMVAGTGEAPSGLVAYEATQWPAEYRGDLLVTSWGDHRLDRFRLRQRRASVVADSTPIVVGNENFRPVGVAVAPDGSVYFSDWVDKSYTLHGKGRVWKLSGPEASGVPAKEQTMAGGLVSADRAVRERAAWKARESGKEGVVALLAVASKSQSGPDSLGGDVSSKTKTGPDSLGARIRATSLQALIASKDTLDEAQQQLLRKLVASESHPDVQAAAIERLGGAGLDLPVLFQSTQPSVRAAALRVSPIAGANGPGTLAPLWDAQNDSDPFIRQAAWSTLARHSKLDLKAELAARQSPAERLAVALLARQRDDAASRDLLNTLLRDDDARVRFVAIQWIGELRLVDYRGAIEETLRLRAPTRQLFEVCLATLERLDGTDRKPTEESPGEQYVVPLLLDDKTPLEVRRRALRMLRPDHPALRIDVLRKFLEHSDPELRLEAIRSLREHPSAERASLLVKLAQKSDVADRERAEAVMGLDATAAPETLQRATLLDLAVREPTVIAIEALRGLRGLSLRDDERQKLSQARSLGEGWQALRTKVLAAPTDATADAPKPESAEKWLAKLAGPADAEAGERIFYHPRATGCYRCHEFNGRGAGIGPELTAVTRTLSPQRLVESLVDPSREVAPQFAPWHIVTDRGDAFVGMLFAEEVDGTQRYVDSQGREHRVKPAQIDERRPVEKSIMPDGLPHLLTEQEFRDLVAFLKRSQP